MAETEKVNEEVAEWSPKAFVDLRLTDIFYRFRDDHKLMEIVRESLADAINRDTTGKERLTVDDVSVTIDRISYCSENVPNIRIVIKWGDDASAMDRKRLAETFKEIFIKKTERWGLRFTVVIDVVPVVETRIMFKLGPD